MPATKTITAPSGIYFHPSHIIAQEDAHYDYSLKTIDYHRRRKGASCTAYLSHALCHTVHLSTPFCRVSLSATTKRGNSNVQHLTADSTLDTRNTQYTLLNRLIHCITRDKEGREEGRSPSSKSELRIRLPPHPTRDSRYHHHHINLSEPLNPTSTPHMTNSSCGSDRFLFFFPVSRHCLLFQSVVIIV
jgi:hypothetical protein